LKAPSDSKVQSGCMVSKCGPDQQPKLCLVKSVSLKLHHYIYLMQEGMLLAGLTL
jgi:hypothetical protein